MANRTLFSTQRQLPQTTGVNRAGGSAYVFTDEHALCQYVVTGTFQQTYYATAADQLEQVKKLVANVRPELIAKAAVYGHETGRMKDVPAYLLAVLLARGESALFDKVFPRVVTNAKMLCNFVQIVRSGVTGRKSFGTVGKRAIQKWLVATDPGKLFNGSIGQANPSVADVIKMVHPAPQNASQEAAFRYLIGKNTADDLAMLPTNVIAFELFKQNPTGAVPNVPFRALTNCGLNTQQWTEVAVNMPWNTLRMNLNMLDRNGVFGNPATLNLLAAKLADADEVRKSKVFPYQLLTAYQNTDNVPQQLRNALQKALEVATENTPVFDGQVAVCIDLSGSMGSPVTGYSAAPSKTTCIDVACLFASSIARRNPDTHLIGWASNVGYMNTFVNPMDSIVTNSRKMADAARQFGGGTNSELALALMNKDNKKADIVIYVSDNASWMHSNYGGGTGMMREWTTFKKRNPKAKLICIDILANSSSSVPDTKDILNVGGFNDAVFSVVDNWTRNSSNDFVATVNGVDL